LASWRRGVFLVVFTALLASQAAPVRAELPYRVVLLRPAVTEDVTSDALARVHGELTAAGFEVSMLAPPPELDVRTALETVGRELAPIGAFAIVRVPTGNTAEIWVCDRLAGKSVIQSVRLDSSTAPGQPSRAVVLAVQAVELLKASLAQYWLASLRRAPQPPASVDVPPPPRPSRAMAGLGIEAAVGWLDNVGAVTAAWQPILRASYGGARGWAGRATVAGLGPDAAVRAPTGSARIRQQLAAAELVRGFRAGKRVQPVLSGGGGAYRARIEGVGIANTSTGKTTDNWSALLTVGGGVALPIVAHLALAADAHLLLTWPHTIVRFGSVEAGATGWPALLVSAGVLTTF
jgi:hypothetical protein